MTLDPGRRLPAHIKTSSTDQVPVRYSSPISGFSSLLEDAGHSRGPSSESELGDGDADYNFEEDDVFSLDSREEQATSLDTLGLRKGPFRQNTASRENPIISHPSAKATCEDGAEGWLSHFELQSRGGAPERLPEGGVAGVKEQDDELLWPDRSECSDGPSRLPLQLEGRPVVLAMSTLLVSTSSQTEAGTKPAVQESWDEDFIFQDDADCRTTKESLSMGSRSNNITPESDGKAPRWSSTEEEDGDGGSEVNEEEEEEAEDWDRPSSASDCGALPQSSSGRTLRAAQDSDTPHSPIQRDQQSPSDDLSFAFPSPAKRRAVSMQILKKATPQDVGTSRTLANTSAQSGRGRVPSESTNKPQVSSGQSSSQINGSREPVLHSKIAGSSASGPDEFYRSQKDLRMQRNSPEQAKRPSTSTSAFSSSFRRKMDGLINSKGSHSKSPAKANDSQSTSRTSLQASSILPETLDSDSRMLPSYSPESSTSIKTDTDNKKPSHKKGGASLSLSFGLGSPWNRSQKAARVSHDERGTSTIGHNALGSRPNAGSKEGTAMQQALHPQPRSEQGAEGDKIISKAPGSWKTSPVSKAKGCVPASSSTEGTFGRSKGLQRTSIINRGMGTETVDAGSEVYDRPAHATGTTKTATDSTSSLSKASTNTLGTSARLSDERGQSNSSRPKSVYALQEIKNGIPQDSGAMGRRRNTTVSAMPCKDDGISITIPDSRFQSLHYEKTHAGQIRSAIDTQMRIPSDPTHRNVDERKAASSSISVSRRNSSGDLKIPSRITKAQEGIRNNISRVKDFASGVEELKALQLQYQERLLNCKMTDRKRIEIMEEYGNWWECAEVLVGLGEGKGTECEEVDVAFVDKARAVSQMEANASPARMRSSTRPPAVTNSSDMSQTSMQGTGGRESRTTSSRASSSRSVDPLREVDILSAMLAGTSIENLMSSRPSTPHRERTLSTSEVSTTSRSPPQNDVGGSRSRQGSSQVRTNKRHSAIASTGKVDVSPTFVRSRSHQLSPSSPDQSVVYQNHAGQERVDISNTSAAYPGWAASTDSISTQATANRRARLRSAGRAGLQGLKELLRSLRFNAAASPYGNATPSQSRLSLARTNTNDSRITLDQVEGWKAEEGRDSEGIDQSSKGEETSDSKLTKSMLRSRSVFQKPNRSSNEASTPSQRYSLNSCNDEQSDHESRHSHQSSVDSPSAVLRSLERSRKKCITMQSPSDAQESSLDSNWTTSEFDNGPFQKDEARSPAFYQEAGEVTSSMGKRRQSPLTKGPPPSAYTLHSLPDSFMSTREVNRDNGKTFSTVRRRSLQIPGDTQANSISMTNGCSPTGNHPASKEGTFASSEQQSIAPPRRPPRVSLRSASSSSSSSFSTSHAVKSQEAALRQAIEQVSMRRTVAPTSGYESTNTSSSGTQTEVQDAPSGRRSRQKDIAVRERKRISNSQLTPPRASRTQQPGKFKKLMLQPEAMSSLLIYLDTTKERCQECLELLRLDLPSQTLMQAT